MNFRWLNARPMRALLVAAVTLTIPMGMAHAIPPATKDRSAHHTLASTVSALDPDILAAIKAAPAATQWPNSNYMRLLDLGTVTIKSDGTTVARYRETYKLFNERARQLAEVSIPYNSSYESVHVLSARTIRKDGTVVEIKPSDIRVTSPYSEYLMYDDAVSAGFSMPAIEDDCIIDYTWEMVTRPVLMPGNFWTYWGFSGPEPVGVSRYVLNTPVDKPIKFKSYNDPTLQPIITTSLDGKTKTYTWEKSNLSPMDLEPAMPDISDCRIWMEVSSLDSWQNIADWFWKLQHPQATPTDAIRTTVSKLIDGKKSDDDRARVIYDWVANRTRYVGLEFGMSAFRPHPASEVHDKLYGDCKDKATLLITMLGLAGIKAHPVLLHAEEHRPVGQGLPSLNAFDHCIALAEIGGREKWLDATAETCAYGDIPDGDRGVEAFVVRDGIGAFQTIPTYQPKENGMDINSAIVVHPDGSADTDTTISMRGAVSQSMRAAVRSITPDKRKEMMQQMAQRFSTGAALKEFKLPDGADKDGPFDMRLQTTAPQYGRKTGSLLLMPLTLGASRSEHPNPFIKEKRVWPIVMEETSAMHYSTTLTLPEGYTIEDLPENVDLVGPLEEYHRKLIKSDDGKSITVVDTYLENAGKVLPGDYAKIRGYYDSLLKIEGDEIVLKKSK